MSSHLLWLTQALSTLPRFEVWGYQVHNSLFPNGYIDITRVTQKKRKLLQYYESQLTHCYRYDHIAMGLAAWNSRFLPGVKGSGLEHSAEVFFALPDQEFFDLVEHFYFTDLDATYRGHISLSKAMQDLHYRVLNQHLSV